ncbi:g1342 [Coccomyxa elongata]
MGSHPWLRLGEKQKQRHTPKPPSFNTFLINSLGPCSRQWVPAQSGLEKHLRPVERPACNDYGETEEPSTSGRVAELQVPLKLRLTGSPNGKPDLQLHLFTLNLGEAAGNSHGRAGRGRQSPHLSDAAKALESAAALLFLQLVFPDSVPAVVRRLAWIGAVSSGAQAAASAAPQRYRDRLERRLRRNGAQAMRILESRKYLGSSGLKGAKLVVGQATDWVERYSAAAAGLVVAASFWSVVHPPSYHLLRCIAAALPVWAGYAETARACASGRVPDGPPAEAAWRARHKWAAQRLAHLLSDAHEKPPLRPAFDLLETLSLNIGLAIDGMAVGSFATPALATSGAGMTLESATDGRGWAAPGPGSPFSIVGSLRTHTPDPNAAVETPGRADAGVAKGKSAVQGPVVWDMGKQAWVPAPKKPKQIAGPRSPRSGEAPRPPGSAAQSVTAINRAHEGFATSVLPTISSQEELEAYQRQVAARPASAAHKGSTEATPRTRDTDAASLGASPVQHGGSTAGGTELALYGRGDHMDFDAELTLEDRATMAARAAYLVAIFLPFFLLAPLLFLLANLLLRWDLPSSQPLVNGDRASVALNGEEAGISSGESQIGLRRAEVAAEEAAAKAPGAAGIVEEVEEIPRAAGAGMQASTSSLADQSWAQTAAAKLRLRAWRLLLFGIRHSGAAFIKWGQWSATREDLFPQDVCMVLAELHDRAPVHSWEASKVQIEEAFGKPVEELFDSIDHAALASGSIAQVHRAVLQLGGEPRQVVVKVRHPNVARNIAIDFRLLKPVAAAASRVPSLKGLSLKESLAQFSANMTAQTDLRVEAVHLRRFYNNFASVRSSVTPPLPVPGMATEAVLVETFEAGESVAKYIRQPSPYNTQIVALGVDTYLKMLLHDNFVHTDLHPGNILVRVRPSGKDAANATTAALDDILMKPIRHGQAKAQLQLILLDFGLAEELTPRVRKHFISFLHAISKGDAAAGTRHMLAFGKHQTCPDPAAFQLDMTAMFRAECNIYSARGVDVDRVLKSALQLARKHEVVIDSSYAALVVGVCVIVGFATALDPAVNLIDAATSAFFINDLTGRIAGRLYT